MRYLITGATGFLGPYLIRRLLSDGQECRCLVRPGSDTTTLTQPGVELVRGDISDPQTLAGIASGMDRMIHMATLGHMDNYTVTEEMFEMVNVRGTTAIMHEASKAGVDKVVHCSSVAAMGICRDVPADEKSDCQPHHPYGRSKLKAEKEVQRLVNNEGLPAPIVRFSMIYGPGDPRDILKLTRLAKKGLFPKIGNKPKLTPLIHAEDAVDGLLLALEKGIPGDCYLITNPTSEPFDTIRKILLQALGIKRPPLYIPEWAAFLAASILEKSYSALGRTPPVSRKNIESTLADRVFSVAKATAELDFHTRIDPQQGLMETVSWYKKKGWV